MGKCCKWFKKYLSELEAHLRDNDSGCRPPEGWWLVLTIAESVSSSAIISFRTLEGKTALVAEQSAQFQSLFDKYKEKFNAKVGLDDTTRTEVKIINCAAPVWPPLPCVCSRYAFSPSGNIAVDTNSLLELLRDDGNFTIAAMGVISPDELYNLLFEVARVLAEIMEGLN
ncbi:hypothetical protein PF005_g22133 [Phytophthora fragariae]|nr:hypothetical protein PF005_g22133 [Phytophthora fragariae]